MEKYGLSIDQGTTSTRAIVFDESGSVMSTGQLEHKQIMTKPSWVEHDPMEIWGNAPEVIGTALSRANITRHDIAAVGITNQRETTIIWNKTTGKPVCPKCT
jgi:glycerol kinase